MYTNILDKIIIQLHLESKQITSCLRYGITQQDYWNHINVDICRNEGRTLGMSRQQLLNCELTAVMTLPEATTLARENELKSQQLVLSRAAHKLCTYTHQNTYSADAINALITRANLALQVLQRPELVLIDPELDPFSNVNPGVSNSTMVPSGDTAYDILAQLVAHPDFYSLFSKRTMADLLRVHKLGATTAITRAKLKRQVFDTQGSRLGKFIIGYQNKPKYLTAVYTTMVQLGFIDNNGNCYESAIYRLLIDSKIATSSDTANTILRDVRKYLTSDGATCNATNIIEANHHRVRTRKYCGKTLQYLPLLPEYLLGKYFRSATTESTHTVIEDEKSLSAQILQDISLGNYSPTTNVDDLVSMGVAIKHLLTSVFKVVFITSGQWVYRDHANVCTASGTYQQKKLSLDVAKEKLCTEFVSFSPELINELFKCIPNGTQIYPVQLCRALNIPYNIDMNVAPKWFRSVTVDAVNDAVSTGNPEDTVKFKWKGMHINVSKGQYDREVYVLA